MLTGVVETIRGIDIDSMTRRQLEAFISECGSAESAMAERRLRAMSTLDGLGDGGLPSSAVLRSQAKVSDRVAKAAAKTALALDAMPQTRGQLAAGTITEEHAIAAAAAAERVGDAARADEALARNAAVPADLYATKAREWADRNEEQDQVDARHRRQRRNRKLIFGRDKTDGSFSLYATTDTAEGGELKGLVEAEADRLYQEDGGRENPTRSRTDEQRRIDALAALIRRGAGVGDASAKPKRPHPRYEGVITISIDDYLDPSDITGQLVGSGPLPRSVLQRMLCDGSIAPLVVDGEGRPLWMGYETRTATDAQWKALIVRDQGCVVCGADPSRCEAHHIVYWRRGGPSDITNLVLLCTRHHHELHDHDLQLTRRDGRWLLTPGAGPPRPRKHRADRVGKGRKRSKSGQLQQ